MVGCNIYKIYEGLFLSREERENVLLEGIQTEDLNEIRSNSCDKKKSSVDAENKLNDIYGDKYRIRLDHQILTDHNVFYPQALFHDLVFELKLASASQVVKGSDPKTTTTTTTTTKADKHPDGVRNKEQPNAGRRGAERVYKRQRIRL